jgi:hypothetical protein
VPLLQHAFAEGGNDGTCASPACKLHQTQTESSLCCSRSGSAAQRGSIGGGSPPLSATTALTSTGHLLGYTTTYTSACEPLTRALASGLNLDGSGSGEEEGARPSSCNGQVETRRFEVRHARRPEHHTSGLVAHLWQAPAAARRLW